MPQPPRPVEILIVDDDQEDIELLVDALREEGIDNPVRVNVDAAEALRQIEGSDRDTRVVLLDLQMPHIDGFELLRRLEALRSPEGQLPRILVLSASTHPEDRERALALGANEFLEKPVDRTALRSIGRSLDACERRGEPG